uniref:Polyprotein protein n=1 Tax=Solanum tuberosum TaxID=4113 RepID=M1DVA8_SOLTU
MAATSEYNSDIEGDSYDFQAFISEHEDNKLLQAHKEKLHPKVMHDPSRIPIPQTTPAPEHTVVPAPQVQCPPPLSLNRLEAEGLRTILEEKRLSTDRVVDMYLEIWNTLMFHKYEIFTTPRGPYIPNGVREFYLAYKDLVSKGKNKGSAFKPVDNVINRGKRVKCESRGRYDPYRGTNMPNQANDPSGTSVPSSSEALSTSVATLPPRSATASAFRPPITKTMLYKMGNLAHFADVRASWLEADIPGMIERASGAALIPLKAEIDNHKLALDALVVIVGECEKVQGPSDEVTALQADITGLRKDLDHVKSTDLSFWHCGDPRWSKL